MAQAINNVLAVVTAADDVLGPAQGQWTYADYMALPDDGLRYEVLDGVLYMAPAPGEAHQFSISRLVHYLVTHVDFAGLGRVYPAPFDVLLDPTTTVQPDIIVVLNTNLDIVTPQHIVGAPDLVIEIASPSTATYDRGLKLHAYARAGVREYWIVDPHAHTIELLVLEHDAYRSRGAFLGAAVLPSTIIPNFPIQVAQFFL